MNDERVREDGLPRWTAPRAAPRHGNDSIGWFAASAFAVVAVFLGGIIVVGNVSMAFHRDDYPAAGTASFVMAAVVPLVGVLAYLYCRRRPDHRPAIVLRRVAVTLVIVEVPLLWLTFGIALSGLGG